MATVCEGVTLFVSGVTLWPRSTYIQRRYGWMLHVAISPEREPATHVWEVLSTGGQQWENIQVQVLELESYQSHSSRLSFLISLLSVKQKKKEKKPFMAALYAWHLINVSVMCAIEHWQQAKNTTSVQSAVTVLSSSLASCPSSLMTTGRAVFFESPGSRCLYARRLSRLHNRAAAPLLAPE